MAKKVNREKLLDVFSSDIPGAVIISADSYYDEVFIVPGVIGIKTYIGCVEFGAGDTIEIFNDEECKDFDEIEGIMRLSPKKCKAIFKDVPINGTAWLVTPQEYGYLWERIDHLLKFQNEKDEQEAVVAEMYEKRFNLRVGEKI